MEDQEEKDLKKFSWTCLFTVTGVCCVAFYFLLQMLDGAASIFFVKVGFFNILIGLLLWVMQLPRKSVSRDA